MAYPVIDMADWDDDMGDAGLPGGGVTSGQLAAAVADRAPANAGYITKTAESGLSNEFALSSMSTGLVKVTTGTGALTTATGSDIPAHSHTSVVSLAFPIDGGGSVIALGNKGYLRVPFAGTIKSWTILGELVNGTITIDIWRDSYANYPPTNADTITASAKPAISSTGNKASSSTLTGWTTAVNAGDVFAFNVDAVASMTKVTIYLDIERTV